MSILTTSPIRDCKRLEQHAIFKELKRAPGVVRKVNLLQNILKPLVYFLFLFFLGFSLVERIGAIGFVLVFVGFCMLFDELVWRFLVIPVVDSELRRQAEHGTDGNHH